MPDLPEHAPTVRITESQLAVLRLIADGLTTSQIARKLHRSPRTVESHRYQLGKRLNAQNPVDLVRRAREAGILGNAPPQAAAESRAPEEVDEDSILSLLRTIDPCHATGSGHAALASLLSRLTLALGAKASFVRWTRTAGRCRAVVCWGPDGPATSRDWQSDDCPASELVPGQIQTFTQSQLGPSVAADVRNLARGDTTAVLTLHGLFDDKKVMGVLGLVHGAAREIAPHVRLVLRMVAARAAAELFALVARERLERERELGRLLEMGSKAGWIRWLAECERFELSSRAAFLLGVEHERSAVPAAQLLARVHADDRAGLLERMGQPNAGEGGAVRLRTASQPERPLRLFVMPWRNADTVERGFQGVLTDETSNASSPEITATVQTMVSHCSDPSVVVDEHGGVLAASAGWRDMVAPLGGDPSERTYPALAAELFGSDAGKAIGQRLRQGVNGTRPGPEQLRLDARGRAGVLRHVDIVPLPSQGIAVIRHVMEADAGPPEGAALSSEERSWEHRWLLEQSSDLICTCNLQGWLLRANPAMRRVLERDTDELRARPITDLFVEEDRDTIRANLARLASGGRVDRLLSRMTTPGGGVLFIEWSCTPPAPGSTEFLSIGRDVTAQLEAKRRLHEARSSLDEYLSNSAAMN